MKKNQKHLDKDKQSEEIQNKAAKQDEIFTEETVDTKESDASEQVNDLKEPESDLKEIDPLQLLIEQVSIIEEQKKEAEEKFVRLAAEFENYKKRMARDYERQSDMIREKIFMSILPVLDDLDRLLQHEEENKNVSLDGIKLIKSNFIKILNGFGVMSFDAVGKPFDPDKHDAMLTQKSDEYDVPTVVDEFEKGYMINDKVLRHARVIVSTTE